MGKSASEEIQGDLKLAEARRLMEAALTLLDESTAPADIGAHLDAALCRLDVALTGPHYAASSVQNNI